MKTIGGSFNLFTLKVLQHPQEQFEQWFNSRTRGRPTSYQNAPELKFPKNSLGDFSCISFWCCELTHLKYGFV